MVQGHTMKARPNAAEDKAFALCLRGAFRRFQRMLQPANFVHYWQGVLLVATSHGRRSLGVFTAVTARHRPRQSLSRFLEEELGSTTTLLKQKAWNLLRQRGWRAGQMLYGFWTILLPIG